MFVYYYAFLTFSPAFVGVLFPKDQEPAFANFRFWQAISYTVAFASSIPDFVCVLHKMIALLCGLCLAMALYYRLEWRLRHDLADRGPTKKDAEIKMKMDQNNGEMELFLQKNAKLAEH